MKKSTKNQIKAEFFEFLRENNCASKFCVNFYNKKGKEYRHKWGATKGTINTYLNEETSKDWVLEAFSWIETIQDYDYWADIHYAWKQRAKAIEYNIQKSKDETNSH